MLGLLILASLAAAPSPAPSATPTALPQIGSVSTADRRLEPISRSSRPTYVITRVQIDDAGAKTVGDALVLVPGIAPRTDYYGFGNVTNYGIRGASSAQTLVLLDGLPISGASTGTFDLGTYPLTGVDRLEVVESGGSTLYGTSAVGGIINIITSPANGLDAGLSDGSYADRQAQLSVGDGHLGASFSRRIVNNAFAYPAFNYPGMPFPAGVRTDAWADASSARFNLAEPLGPGFSVRADLGADALIGGAPSRLDFLTPTASQSLVRDALTIDVSRAGAQSLVSLAVSTARQALVFTDPNPFDCGGESDTYDGRTQVSLKDVFTQAQKNGQLPTPKSGRR